MKSKYLFVLLSVLLAAMTFTSCEEGVGTRRNPNGEFCSADTECISNHCTDDSICASNSSNNGSDVSRPNGAECSSNSQCASKNCKAKVCTVADVSEPSTLANGETCAANSHCLSGNCNSGLCQPPYTIYKLIANGSTCKDSGQCASGNCDNHVCKVADGTEGGKLVHGAACVADEQCYSGRCGDDHCQVTYVGGGNGGGNNDNNNDNNNKEEETLLLNNGLACSSNAQCASNNCSENVCKANIPVSDASESTANFCKRYHSCGYSNISSTTDGCTENMLLLRGQYPACVGLWDKAYSCIGNLSCYSLVTTPIIYKTSDSTVCSSIVQDYIDCRRGNQIKAFD